MKSILNTETATLYLHTGRSSRKVATYGQNVKFEKLPSVRFVAGKYSVYALTWKYTKGFYICRENDFSTVGGPKVECIGGLELLGGYYHVSPDDIGNKGSVVYEIKTGSDGLYTVITYDDKVCIYNRLDESQL